MLLDNLSKIMYISLLLMMSHPVTSILQLPLTVVHTPQLTFHDLEVNIQAAGFACIRLLIFLTFRLCLLVECEVLTQIMFNFVYISSHK